MYIVPCTQIATGAVDKTTLMYLERNGMSANFICVQSAQSLYLVISTNIILVNNFLLFECCLDFYK